MNYHAHVYFDLEQRPLAQTVLSKASLEIFMRPQGLLCRKVGPHAKPMLEIHFTQGNKERVLHWLEQNRQGLQVLIHPDTGDDHRDHRPENIIWLGGELPLDFTFFDLVKARPELSLH